MKQSWKLSVILATLAANLVLPSAFAAADKAAVNTSMSPTAVAPATNTATINVNTASVEQLATIKGLGPKKAQAIIDYRQQNGPFKTVADLGNVSGIGDKLLASITPYVNANPA